MQQPARVLRPRTSSDTKAVSQPTAGPSSALARPSLPLRQQPAEQPTSPATAVAAAAAPASPASSGAGAPAASGRPADTSDTGPAVTATEAIALIARQPAFLEVPLQRLCGRCYELAELLEVTPYQACLCLSRMTPEELDLTLQAQPQAIQSAFARLAAAMATLEQQRQQQGLGFQDAAPASVEGEGADRGDDWPDGSPEVEGLPLPSPLAVPPPRPRFPAATHRSETTRRMVLQCPRLLMLRAGAVRASALHLRSLLGVTYNALRSLLARNPRLLLLPPEQRVATLDALVRELRLRDPQVAARLVAQQPAMLHWTPAALRGKLEEMGSALGLAPDGVARLCRNQPILLAMSSDHLAAKLARLQQLLGLPGAEEARQVVLRQPGTLSMSSDAVERKLGQLGELFGGQGAYSGKRVRLMVPRGRAKRGAGRRPSAGQAGGGAGEATGLAVARQLATAEPTLLTMNMSALPQRLAGLEEALEAAGPAEVRAAVMACPTLLVLQRQALLYRLRELAWGLDAPPAALRALVRARPDVLFAGLAGLRAACARAEAAGAGQGLSGRRRVAAVLEHLAQDGGDCLAQGSETS
ncbi:hypothetical protein GPECTOR_1g380 [Gonium pectorale]|uniref:Uncharacterized protein n=1 Tax=Gonium pectorale TaxID=33097 RepID=A0A150H2M2_GONPE|nr:hypothetical protein GPECTOR_1g380 [Gonium pectorale]|eukprot:KXZ56427.1 hypothetical protein GPECTOR_1g380 [Gonium pectorale]